MFVPLPSGRRPPARHRRTAPPRFVAGSSIVRRIDQSRDTLFLAGEIDLDARPRLVEAARDLVAHCRDRSRDTGSPAVIDADGLTLVDALALGVFVELHRAPARVGVRLHTVHADARLRRLSAICDLDAALGLDPTEAPADSRPYCTGRTA